MAGGLLLSGENRGPQNPLSTFNPVLKVPFEAMANTNTFLSTPVDRTGDMSLLGRAGKQAAGSIAQYRFWSEW